MFLFFRVENTLRDLLRVAPLIPATRARDRDRVTLTIVRGFIFRLEKRFNFKKKVQSAEIVNNQFLSHTTHTNTHAERSKPSLKMPSDFEIRCSVALTMFNCISCSWTAMLMHTDSNLSKMNSLDSFINKVSILFHEISQLSYI